MSGDHVVVHGLEIVRGSLRRDITEHLTSSTISGGTGDVSEITLELEDPGWRLMSSGIFVVGESKFDWHVFKTTLAAVEVSGGSGGHGAIRAQFRSRAVRNLKQRKGVHSERNVSASEYVKRECERIGVTAYTQPSPKRKQIARDVPKEGEPVPQGADAPSAWTTFQRLAREQGYIVFEFGNVIYFGTPSWCVNRNPETTKVQWINGPDHLRPLEAPVARRSEDATVPVTISLVIPRHRYNEFRPGRAIEVSGMPTFDGKYIINNISYDINRMSPLTVECGTAIDPVVESEGKDHSVTERGIGEHKHIVDAAKAAGFTGQSLEIAVAVALAESGGNVRAVSPPNTAGKAAGSRDHGLWQINDYYHVFDKVLIYNAEYNAKQAYRISTNGTNWNPWTTFRNGAYLKHMETARNSIERITSIGLTDGAGVGKDIGRNRLPKPLVTSPQNRGWGGPGVARAGLTKVDVPGIDLLVRSEVAPLFRELIRLLRAYGYSKISSSGGYAYRYIKGTTTWSNHAWGLAADFNAATNYGRRSNGQLITDMPSQANAIANSLGMRWGGTFKSNPDAMHYEFMGTPADARQIAIDLGLVVVRSKESTNTGSGGRGGV